VALVSIENLNIRFGATHAVRGLSLDVAAGESLGLVGESGSGKSVTALAILRLLDAAATVEGRIAFEGAICWRFLTKKCGGCAAARSP